MTDNDKMREEFEHYVATKTLMSLQKYTSGSYKHSSTQQSWETWQAAQAELAAELERLRNVPDAEQEHLYANAHRLYARGFNACRELWMKAASQQKKEGE